MSSPAMASLAAPGGAAAACAAVTAPRLFRHQRSTFRACQQGRHHHNMQGHSKKLGAASAKQPPVKLSGGVLLSHAVPRAVPSALKGLTSGFGMGPGVSPSLWPPKHYGDVVPRPHLGNRTVDACTRVWELPPRPGVVEAKPLGLLVPVSSTCCHASTSGLSTQSSSWGPYRVNPEGDLILRRASRLDAFSGYPFRT